MELILKYLTTLITLQLIIGIIVTAYDSQAYSTSTLDTETSKYDEIGNFMRDEEKIFGNPSPDTQITDASYGNAITWGSLIMKVFIYGFTFFSPAYTATNAFDVLLKYIYDIIKMLMTLSTIVLSFAFIKGRWF